MTFFYNLNKTLDAIRAKPETTHGQLNERDEGKPGKNFAKISKDAAERYGSKEAGERVAGAVRAKLAKQGKLEEEGMSRAAKGYEKYGKEGMEALAKAGREGKDLDKIRAKYNKYDESMDEGFVDSVKSVAQKALDVMGGPGDEELIRDLQRKAGVPQTGKVPMATPNQPGQQPTGQQPTGQQPKPGQNPTTAGQQPMSEEGGMPMTPKQKSFAALAEPKDKITFADKIAGAKKEVDEMLGDVAAEAMKNALRGKQQMADEGNAFTGKLKATPKGGKFKMGNKEYTDNSNVDEGWDDMLKDVEKRRTARKIGQVTHGAKHDTEETPTGRRVTRRVDDKGYSVGSDTDDEGNAKSTEKRGRGRPKSTDKKPERVTAKATKHKGGRKMSEDSSYGQAQQIYSELADIRAVAKQAQGGGKFPAGFASRLESSLWAAMTLIKNNQPNDAQVYEEELDEKAVSKKQQKFMGMVHATQKGEKAPSKEVAKVAKSMGKKDAEDFASTKHKGLPEKAPKKKEKTEETTVAGSVAPAAGGKSKGGSIVGKGIYDSLNRDLEAMISESMNVSVNVTTDDHGEPRKNITVSAEGEAAEQLAQLLNLAGMQGGSMGSDEGCGCETSPCSCEELDENQPDWPTDQETIGNDDPEMRRYAGGLNGPKSTGQTVGAPFNRQDSRQGVMGENKDLGMKLYAELKSFKG